MIKLIIALTVYSTVSLAQLPKSETFPMSEDPNLKSLLGGPESKPAMCVGSLGCVDEDFNPSEECCSGHQVNLDSIARDESAAAQSNRTRNGKQAK